MTKYLSIILAVFMPFMARAFVSNLYDTQTTAAVDNHVQVLVGTNAIPFATPAQTAAGTSTTLAVNPYDLAQTTESMADLTNLLNGWYAPIGSVGGGGGTVIFTNLTIQFSNNTAGVYYTNHWAQSITVQRLTAYFYSQPPYTQSRLAYGVVGRWASSNTLALTTSLGVQALAELAIPSFDVLTNEVFFFQDTSDAGISATIQYAAEIHYAIGGSTTVTTGTVPNGLVTNGGSAVITAPGFVGSIDASNLTGTIQGNVTGLNSNNLSGQINPSQIFPSVTVVGGNNVNTNFFNTFTRYIDAGLGSDTNSGGINDPWITIAKANTNCSLGVTMYVRSGSYSDPITNMISPWYLERGAIVQVAIWNCTNGLIDGFGTVTNFNFLLGGYALNLICNCYDLYTSTGVSGSNFPRYGDIHLNVIHNLLMQWRPCGYSSSWPDATIYATAKEITFNHFTSWISGIASGPHYEFEAHHMIFTNNVGTNSAGTILGILGSTNCQFVAESADLQSDLVFGKNDFGTYGTRIHWQVGHTFLHGYAITFQNNMSFIDSPSFDGSIIITNPLVTYKGAYQTDIP